MDINLHVSVGKKERNVIFVNWSANVISTFFMLEVPWWERDTRLSVVHSLNEMSNVPLLSAILQTVVVGKKYSPHTCPLLRKYVLMPEMWNVFIFVYCYCESLICRFYFALCSQLIYTCLPTSVSFVNSCTVIYFIYWSLLLKICHLSYRPRIEKWTHWRNYWK
jgi:hypothetical protein